MTTHEIETYDYIVDMGIATQEEINLVRNVLHGSWMDIFNAIIFARTGYRTIEQYIEMMEEEEDF